MELEQLRIFISVAENRSFSQAARKLYISHSTTSRAVSALEDELGVRLFERDNRIFSLTKQGELLMQEAQELLERAEEIKNKIKEI